MPLRSPIRKLSLNVQKTIVIFAAILVRLTLGTLYTIGNLNPYLGSYLHLKVPGQEYVNYKLTAWLFALTFSGYSVSFIGGFVEKKFGARWTALIGCTIMRCFLLYHLLLQHDAEIFSLGIGSTYFSVQHSFALCLITYGLIGGFGMAVASMPPYWLPNHPGLASGLISGGFGAGAFVFSPLQTLYVNPWQYKPNSEGYFTQEDLLQRVPSIFRIFAIIYFCLQLIGSLLLMDPEPATAADKNPNADDQERLIPTSRRPIYDHEGNPILDDHEVHPNGIIQEDTQHNQAPSVQNSKPNEPFGVVFKSSTFWCLWFTMFFNGQLVEFVSSDFKIFGELFVQSDYALAGLAAAAAVFSTIGRVVWGYLGDRFSYQSCMAVITAMLTAFMLTIYATRWLGEVAYFIWICLTFFTFSGQFALFSMAMAKAFGTEKLGVTYGTLGTAVAVAAILNSALSTILMDMLDFRGMFQLVSVTSFLGFVATMCIHRTSHGHRIRMGRH